MWQAAQRFIAKNDRDGRYIIYLGDHDPSGIDMTRDITDRMKLFGSNVEVRRIALTMEQVQTFNPPPNPTKITDKRAKNYIKNFGAESWELDALEPQFIGRLIDSEIRPLLDDKILAETFALELEQRRELQFISDHYHDIISVYEKK